MSSIDKRLAAVRNRAQLFESNTTERRRSILFTLAVTAGFLGALAATTVFLSTQNLPIVVLLSVLSGVSFILGGFLFAGRLDELTDDDQVLWQLFED
ncbi:hypothetical protein ACFQJ7_12925 [Halovenus rubra]|uniref:Uncharacterized protein n=2 Tax=Halovenus rubra TaxID=869890 RepID=A0ACC7E3A3_9EURY|nr:hypothetical protein [Halovenus rubra]